MNVLPWSHIQHWEKFVVLHLPYFAPCWFMMTPVEIRHPSITRWPKSGLAETPREPPEGVILGILWISQTINRWQWWTQNPCPAVAVKYLRLKWHYHKLLQISVTHMDILVMEIKLAINMWKQIPEIANQFEDLEYFVQQGGKNSIGTGVFLVLWFPAQTIIYIIDQLKNRCINMIGHEWTKSIS